ncbi:MAG: hypothetical protein PHI10_05060 [Dehalococcoidales bacterium]|nr:hypothetical protein [Dehalococcoidales bacterium]
MNSEKLCGICISAIILLTMLGLDVGFHMNEEFDRSLHIRPFTEHEMQFESVGESHRYLSSYDPCNKYPQYEYKFKNETSEIFYISHEEPIINYTKGETYLVTFDCSGNPVYIDGGYPLYRSEINEKLLQNDCENLSGYAAQYNRLVSKYNTVTMDKTNDRLMIASLPEHVNSYSDDEHLTNSDWIDDEILNSELLGR